jgi:chromosome segregation ATPase
MARISVSVSDSILNKVDIQANKDGLTRSAWISAAIESTISGSKQADEALHNSALELNKAQTDVMQLNRQIAKLNNQIAEKDKAIESTSKEVNQLREKLNQADENLIKAQQETAKYELALKGKEDEISFLRAHVAQLTQSISQLSLPPSPEEIKEKGSWWKFWR